METFEGVTKEDVLSSFSDHALGEGAEAKVFRIRSHPDFTIRRSTSLDSAEVEKYLRECEIIANPPLFGTHNFAQAVAYLKHPSMSEQDDPLLTINRYCSGDSIEVTPPKSQKAESQIVLEKTKEKTALLLRMSDQSMDAVFDDLLFLSSKKYSIDAGLGFFTNLGNALHSKEQNRLFLIDIQPFLYDRVGIPNNHTKGFNTPFFLAQSILPGDYAFRKEHGQDKELIEMRSEMVDKIICAAERNHLSDRGGYLGEGFWTFSLREMNIPERRISDFSQRMCRIQDKKRYEPERENGIYKRVNGRSGYS